MQSRGQKGWRIGPAGWILRASPCDQSRSCCSPSSPCCCLPHRRRPPVASSRRGFVPVDVVQGHILVTVQVNDAAATFVLDTGADRTLMGEDAVRRLGLERDTWVEGRPSKALAASSSGRTPCRCSLRLGAAPLRRRTLSGDTSVTVGPLPVAEIAARPIAGLLGRDFLSPFDLDLGDLPGSSADPLRRDRLRRRLPALDPALCCDPGQYPNGRRDGGACGDRRPAAARADRQRCQQQPDPGAGRRSPGETHAGTVGSRSLAAMARPSGRGLCRYAGIVSG